MKILVTGPINYEYSQCIVDEMRCTSEQHEVLFYPMLEFYTTCSYLERKLFKLGAKWLKKSYDANWERKLCDLCEQFRPDLIVFLNGMMLTERLLVNLEKYRKTWWLWDAIDRMGETYYKFVPFFDRIAVFEFDDIKRLSSFAGDVLYLPLGYSKYYDKALSMDKDIDISFVGMPNAYRVRLLEKIATMAQANNWKMFVGGQYYDKRWPWKKMKFGRKFPNLIRYVHNEIISMEMAADIYKRSKICLNINTPCHKSSNPRSFEIMAANSLMMYNSGELNHNLFQKDIDYVEFVSEEELLEKLKYYLAHNGEREAITKSGNMRNQKYSLRASVEMLLSNN